MKLKYTFLGHVPFVDYFSDIREEQKSIVDDISLINKNENYFVDMFDSLTQTYSKDEDYESTATFFSEIKTKKKDKYSIEYNKGNKFNRINKKMFFQF